MKLQALMKQLLAALSSKISSFATVTKFWNLIGYQLLWYDNKILQSDWLLTILISALIG